MPLKWTEDLRENSTQRTLLFPFSQPTPLNQEQTRFQNIQVRPPQKIPKKILNYFKTNIKTGNFLSQEKQFFLAQVLLHELDEGVRILEHSGRFEQAQILRSRNPKIPLINQMQLLRDWLSQDPLLNRPPERIENSYKIRNNQNGTIDSLFPEGKLVGFTEHGIFYKDRNEDALLTLPSFGLLALMDGMGGHVGGNIASGILVDFIEYGLLSGACLEKAIEDANEAILQRSQNDSKLGGDHPMGSTLVCAQIRESTLKCLHIGDSKLLLIRDGKIIYATQDHTNGQELWHQNLVDLETAHALNHMLTRSLGFDSIFASRDLERFDIDLQKGDRILLASDGITDNFYNQSFELGELAQIASENSLKESLENIHRSCLDRIRNKQLPSGKRAKPDNLSVLLYEHL